MNWIRFLLVTCVIMLGLPLSAHAATQTIIGDSSAVPPTSVSDPPRPLTIYVGDNGSLQAKRAAPGENVTGMFFGGSTSPGENFWHLRIKGAPASDVTFGPRDTAALTDSNLLDPSGAWTAASPARVNTVMRVQHQSVNLFEVKQTVLYVARALSYRVIWNVRNIDPQGRTIPFIFGTSADLFIDSDAGEGLPVASTPPRFLGGRNKFTGTIGGVEEVTSSQLPEDAGPILVAPWASWEEGDPFPVTRRLGSADAFLNTFNPLFMDNAVGVSWNNHATAGLAHLQTARYEVLWHLSRPGATALATPAPAPAPAAAALPSMGAPAVPPAPSATSADTTAAGAGATTAANPGGRSAASVDGDAPVLSALRVAPTAAGSPPKVVFRLSERADVVLRIVRRIKRRQVTVRRLTRANLRPGTRTIAPGVGSGAKRLKPGSYVVFAQAVDAAGNRGARRSAAFRITR